MRKKIAAGNWKMNTNYKEGVRLATKIAKNKVKEGTEVILAVPFTHLKGVVKHVKKNKRVFVAAQNVAAEEKGAYTGEVSASMLTSVGVTHVLIGHSERRAYYGENSDVLKKKLALALSHDLVPVFCCGEPLEIRQANAHVDHVATQLKETIFKLSSSDFSKIIVAYEPIWAIGTGETASPDQAQEMHEAIRKMIKEQFGEDLANDTAILYGGSVKPTNAKEIFAKEDVDGGLVGGASLSVEGFTEIINAF